MRRRWISMALCLALLACLLLPVGAAAGTSFLRGSYEIEDWDLLLYGKPLPSDGTLTVSADAQTLDALLTTVGEVGSPVTIYCLVDASTSMKEEQQKQQQDILANIGSRMGENDNMVIATFDEKLVEGGITNDAEVINTTAKTIGRRIWTKNLYQAVVQAISSLETGTQFNKDKLLLILSDGNDCGKTDVTEEKAIAAIQKTTIPVYSIAITGNYMNADKTANAKHLRNLSEASMGGMCVVPAEKKISAANAAEQVWQNVQAGSLIRVNLESVQDPSRDFTLRVRYETAAEQVEDTVTIYAADLPERIEIPETEPSLPVQETEVPPQEAAVPVWVWIAAGTALAVILLIVILVAAKKKKAPPVDDVTPPVITDEPFQEIIQDNQGAGGNTTPINNGGGWNPSMVGSTQPIKPVNGCKLEFVALMHPDVRFAFELPPHDPKTFGRDKRSQFVLNGSDAKLSGVHFEAEWDEKNLYVRDKGSTNGTKLNGGLCKPESWVRVEDGSVLSAGGYEYRVSVSGIGS